MISFPNFQVHYPDVPCIHQAYFPSVWIFYSSLWLLLKHIFISFNLLVICWFVLIFNFYQIKIKRCNTSCWLVSFICEESHGYLELFLFTVEWYVCIIPSIAVMVYHQVWSSLVPWLKKNSGRKHSFLFVLILYFFIVCSSDSFDVFNWISFSSSCFSVLFEGVLGIVPFW